MRAWLMQVTGCVMSGVMGSVLFCAAPALACDLPEGEKTLRVRGWIEWRNDPMIEPTYPEQLELLAPVLEPAS